MTQTECQPFWLKRINKWHYLSNQHHKEFSPAKSIPETHVGELQCLKNCLSQVRDKPIGRKNSKIEKKPKFVFSWPKLIFKQKVQDHGVECARNGQENSSDTGQSVTLNHFLELPLTASSSGCNPHHQLSSSTTLQLKDTRHKGVFNGESKRSETPITETIKKV